MTISVVGVETRPELTPALEALFLAEWERIDPLIDPAGWYPSPLFALNDAGALVGGLAFTRHDEPDGNEPAVWVNAVLVRPESRGRGVATQLIQQAEASARQRGIHRLYAHTEVPTLYTKQGWSVLPGRPDKVSKTIAEPNAAIQRSGDC